MVTIEFVKRTRINNYWLLPGTRAEFMTIGQAGYFTRSGAAKVVSDSQTSADVDPDSQADREARPARRRKVKSAD